MKGLTTLEGAVLDLMLAGESHRLVTLRAQLAVSTVAARELTGVGFFCRFDVPADAPRTDGDFALGEVDAHMAGLQHGAGFVLFVRQGRLSVLEAFTYDEPWPSEISEVTVFRHPPAQPVR